MLTDNVKSTLAYDINLRLNHPYSQPPTSNSRMHTTVKSRFRFSSD